MLYFSKMLLFSLFALYTITAQSQKATLAFTKLNLLYIGIYNNMSITVPNIANKDIVLNASQGIIEGTYNYNGSFIWRVSTPGKALLTISVRDHDTLRVIETKMFRVDYIPPPVAHLGRYSNGTMGIAEFKAQQGVRAPIECCGFEARCEVISFTITRVPTNNGTPIIVENTGARYNPNTRAVIDKTQIGDTYYFTDIKARCPSYPALRTINEMLFNIR